MLKAFNVDHAGIGASERMLRYFVELHSPQRESFEQFYRDGPKRLTKSQSAPIRFTFYDVFCDLGEKIDAPPPPPAPVKIEEPPPVSAPPPPPFLRRVKVRLSSIFRCGQRSSPVVRHRCGIDQLVIRFNDQRTSHLWTHSAEQLKKMRRVQTWKNSYDLRTLDQCLEY